MNIQGKKLYRSQHPMITGLAAGLGEYLEVDPTVMRLVFLMFAFATGGLGIVFYIFASILVPKKSPA